MWPKFILIQAFMFILVSCTNEQDPSKNEGTRVVTTFLPLEVWGFFPDTNWLQIQESRVRSRPGPVEIDHDIISTVILLPSADSFMKGFCPSQVKVSARING